MKLSGFSGIAMLAVAVHVSACMDAVLPKITAAGKN